MTKDEQDLAEAMRELAAEIKELTEIISQLTTLIRSALEAGQARWGFS
jgi:hypothetical protein